jgi:hypothetical protein
VKREYEKEKKEEEKETLIKFRFCNRSITSECEVIYTKGHKREKIGKK